MKIDKLVFDSYDFMSRFKIGFVLCYFKKILFVYVKLLRYIDKVINVK